ncbi:MAG TPA: hypothetical protein VFU96_09650 [Acidimicrobiia bacterium]|nr:hypothetical protein [Acidimicrobiia bacterium]
MTHDQIDRMVRKANPLPDPTALELVDVPVLMTPLERRTEMQIDDRPGNEVQADRNRRRGPIVGIAAAAVILIAGLVLFLTRDNMPVAEPAPNATEITPEEALEAESPLEPGAYFVDTDGDDASSLRGTFVIEGSGWGPVPSGAVKGSEGQEFVMLLVLEVDQVYSPVCDVPAPSPVAAGTTAEDLANQFAASGFTVREALAPVNAFGYEGHHMVVEVPEGCAGETYQAWTGGGWSGRYYQSNGNVVEYWFLDVEGTPVMVEADWFPGTSAEEDVAELQAVVDSLVITP